MHCILTDGFFNWRFVYDSEKADVSFLAQLSSGLKRRISATMSNSKVCITEDEAQLYDRQIRLWGLDAQKRLRAARVLVI